MRGTSQKPVRKPTRKVPHPVAGSSRDGETGALDPDRWSRSRAPPRGSWRLLEAGCARPARACVRDRAQHFGCARPFSRPLLDPTTGRAALEGILSTSSARGAPDARCTRAVHARRRWCSHARARAPAAAPSRCGTPKASGAPRTSPNGLRRADIVLREQRRRGKRPTVWN